MILCLDTSALVKLYVLEASTAEVRGWVGQATVVATSWVAYAEARAAFARALREGVTPAARHQERLAQFNQDWEALLRVQLVPCIARSAGDLAEVHAVRGLDAIHLASALWLRDKSVPGPFVFTAFGERLDAAARQAGLRHPQASE